MGNGARPLPVRFLDGCCVVLFGRIARVAGSAGIPGAIVRRRRCADGADWNDALRECVRAGRTVGTAGLETVLSSEIMRVDRL